MFRWHRRNLHLYRGDATTICTIYLVLILRGVEKERRLHLKPKNSSQHPYMAKSIKPTDALRQMKL